MISKILMTSLVMMLVGCATIKDRDFEKEEKEYIQKYGERALADPLYQKDTPRMVSAANKDHVTVTLTRLPDGKHPKGPRLQNWVAVVSNHNEVDKCVSISWALMDFELITDNISYVKIPAHGYIADYAKFKQKVWEMNGITLALPPSGYITEIDVKDLDKDDKCDFIMDEEDIVTR